MADQVQHQSSLIDVVERSRGAFSGTKGIVNYFSKESPNITNLKALNATEIHMVESYTREAYLQVIHFLSCDQSVHGKLVGVMGSSHTMRKDNYPRTQRNMKNLIVK